MKLHLILLLFAALLESCASYRTSEELHSSKIKVQPIHGADKYYSLLSVRGDTAISVLDWEESDTRPVPFSHALVLQKDSIRFIERESATSDQKTIGMLIGSAAGLGLALASSAASYQGSGGFHLSSDVFSDILLGGSAGYFIGGFVKPVQHLSLASHDDRELLRSIAYYPHKEPQELQSIK